jgi:cytochrome c5
MSAIFISYRRVGALVHARAIFERLRNEFGPNDVFIDLDGIQYGVDFIEVLNEQLNGCRVMLALIDPQWATAKDRRGQPRISQSSDYVRIEIETALRRGVRTVPVLIDGAEMPDAEDLPESLRPLARRNALFLDFSRFDAEITRLIGVIRPILMASQAPEVVITPAIAAPALSSPTPPSDDAPTMRSNPAPSDARSDHNGRIRRRFWASVAGGIFILGILLYAFRGSILQNSSTISGSGPVVSSGPQLGQSAPVKILEDSSDILGSRSGVPFGLPLPESNPRANVYDSSQIPKPLEGLTSVVDTGGSEPRVIVAEAHFTEPNAANEFHRVLDSLRGVFGAPDAILDNSMTANCLTGNFAAWYHLRSATANLNRITLSISSDKNGCDVSLTYNYAAGYGGPPKDGEQVYAQLCAACHAAGIVGAPTTGDTRAWAPLIAKGRSTLYEHAIHGYPGKNGSCPPKGGREDLPDELVKQSVDYMLTLVK